MFDKINVIKIVKDHISTFKDYRTNKYKIGDFILFFGIPLLIAGIFSYFNISLTHNLISLLITSLSIFAALLFNLLLLIYDVVQKTKNESALKIRFLKEVYSNISFCILIAILAVIILILISCYDELYVRNDNMYYYCHVLLSIFNGINDINNTLFIYRIFNFIAYYLIILFLLTLFMILKRIHILLYKEYKEVEK